jgi:hypothetical protein
LPHIKPLSPPPLLTEFSPATPVEVRDAILRSSNSSCSLDTIPTYLLKSCLESLLHPITTIINLAISEGVFPDSFKIATIRPLLKSTICLTMIHLVIVLFPILTSFPKSLSESYTHEYIIIFRHFHLSARSSQHTENFTPLKQPSFASIMICFKPLKNKKSLL